MVPAETELRPHALAQELAAEDADRAGDGAGLSDDLVRRHGDEVAARGGDIPHGDDHRLAGLPGAQGLAVDGVGGDVGAAAAVDPEDDRLDVLVVDRGAEGSRHLGRGQVDRAGERIVLLAAPDDVADPVDEGDRLTLLVRTPGALQVGAEVEQLGALADRLADRVVGPVAVGQLIDQTCVHGLLAKERPAGDQAAHLLGAHAAALGQAGHEGVHDRAHDRFGDLAVGLGVFRLGEDVLGVLVLVAVVHAGLEA